MITFAIPFYSTPEYLDQAIKSVIAQSNSNWRLIVVDDRSPHQGTQAQVQSYGDSRITYYLNPKNLGQSGNWNRCLELAQTELVCILHADDKLQSNYVELMLDAAKRYPLASGIFCRAEIIGGRGEVIPSFADFYKRFLRPTDRNEYTLSGEDGLLSLIPGNFIMCPTICYQKSNLHETNFLPEFKCAPDLDFHSRLLIAGGSLVGLPIVAFSYRRHEESGTEVFRKSLAQFEEEVRLYDLIAERCQLAGWSRAERAARKKQVVKLRLSYFGLKDLVRLRFDAFWMKYQMLGRLVFG